MEHTKYDVFISYSRKDYVDEQKNVIPGNVVSKIKETLAQEGITFWFDEDGIYSGDEFTSVIADAIDASNIFIFVSSVHSNSSPWTTGEIATAQETHKKIIPVRIDSSRYHKSLRVRLNALDFIDFQQNPDKAISDLVSSIKSYLKLLQEEQLTITTDIQLACKALNNEEAKIEHERVSLLQRTSKVTDVNKRESLRALIISSSPIRQKCQEEFTKQAEEEKNKVAKGNMLLISQLTQQKKGTNYSSENSSHKPLKSNLFNTKYIIAILIAIIVILLSWIAFGFISNNDAQEPDLTETINIDIDKFYKLQSDAKILISAGSQTYLMREKNNEVTNEDGGAVESYFINALDIYDQLEGTSGYAQMDNDFKNEVEQNRKTAKEYLTKILKAINDKADQLKKVFGEDDVITKKVNDRIKKIGNRLGW